MSGIIYGYNHRDTRVDMTYDELVGCRRICMYFIIYSLYTYTRIKYNIWRKK